jgi:hypothetical protein
MNKEIVHIDTLELQQLREANYFTDLQPYLDPLEQFANRHTFRTFNNWFEIELETMVNSLFSSTRFFTFFFFGYQEEDDDTVGEGSDDGADGIHTKLTFLLDSYIILDAKSLHVMQIAASAHDINERYALECMRYEEDISSLTLEVVNKLWRKVTISIHSFFIYYNFLKLFFFFFLI